MAVPGSGHEAASSPPPSALRARVARARGAQMGCALDEPSPRAGARARGRRAALDAADARAARGRAGAALTLSLAAVAARARHAARARVRGGVAALELDGAFLAACADVTAPRRARPRARFGRGCSTARAPLLRLSSAGGGTSPPRRRREEREDEISIWIMGLIVFGIVAFLVMTCPGPGLSHHRRAPLPDVGKGAETSEARSGPRPAAPLSRARAP